MRRLLLIVASALVVGISTPSAKSADHKSLVNTLDNSAAEIEELFASLMPGALDQIRGGLAVGLQPSGKLVEVAMRKYN